MHPLATLTSVSKIVFLRPAIASWKRWTKFNLKGLCVPKNPYKAKKTCNIRTIISEKIHTGFPPSRAGEVHHSQ